SDTGNCWIKISKVDEPEILDYCAFSFTMSSGAAAGKITSVGNPPFNETYECGGDPCPITWTYTGPVENVKIEYSLDGDSGPWETIDTVSADYDGGLGPSSYNWAIPSSEITPTINAKIQVSDTGGDFDSNKS
ncbi:unnamed protein product, partial [marine sediment metagenome]